jgi:hypothetical protein
MEKKILAIGSICIVLLLVSTSFASAVNTIPNVEKMEANKNEKQPISILGDTIVEFSGPHLLLVGKEYNFTVGYRNYQGWGNHWFEIDWGDDTTPYGKYLVEGKYYTVSHTYNETGWFIIKATASLKYGVEGKKNHIIRVVTESEKPIWEKLIQITGWIFIFTGGTFLLLILLLLNLINKIL